MPAATPRASMPAACASSRGISPRSRSRSPRWSCGSASRNWSTTIAASPATARCWSPRARTSSASFRARVDELRLHGFTHEELIDRDELKRLVPAVAEHLPRRHRVAPRRRGRSVPHHPGVPPQGRDARRAASSRASTVTGLARARAPSGASRRARADRGAEGRQCRGRLGRPHRGAARRAGAARGDRADADDHRPRAALHRPGGDPARPQALVQAVRQRHRADRRRPSRAALSRREPHGDRLDASSPKARSTVWELFPVMREATIVRAWAGIEARMPDDIPVIGPSSHIGGRLPPVRLLRARLPARARRRRADGRAGRHRRDQRAARWAGDRKVPHAVVLSAASLELTV